MGKWYKQGVKDANDGFCDPPWSEGHRDYKNYMEGYNDQQKQLEYEARQWNMN